MTRGDAHLPVLEADAQRPGALSITMFFHSRVAVRPRLRISRFDAGRTIASRVKPSSALGSGTPSSSVRTEAARSPWRKSRVASRPTMRPAAGSAKERRSREKTAPRRSWYGSLVCAPAEGARVSLLARVGASLSVWRTLPIRTSQPKRPEVAAKGFVNSRI